MIYAYFIDHIEGDEPSFEQVPEQLCLKENGNLDYVAANTTGGTTIASITGIGTIWVCFRSKTTPPSLYRCFLLFNDLHYSLPMYGTVQSDQIRKIILY